MTARYIVKSAAEMKIGEPYFNAGPRHVLLADAAYLAAGKYPDTWGDDREIELWSDEDIADGYPFALVESADVKVWTGEPLQPGQRIAVWRAKSHGMEQLETVTVIEVEYERQRVGDEVVMVAKSLRCEGLAEISVPIGKVVR